uniref:transglycosylase SLT domain-containing protein n=1 Tax=Acinetobacter sp. CFCC 10889 TaxID=1775557 RepID=UPI000DD01A92
MQQAEKTAKETGDGISESMNVASLGVKALSATVAGLSFAGVANFANQTIQAGSDIKKFAELANSSMQQFQFYAKGAATVGIEMESFADKMKDMQDRIGDFDQTKGGPLADFFENIAPKVGVTIEQFQKLSGPEALQLFYSSLEKVNATQNDMKFYMEAIISDSSLLIPLLRNGGEGFQKWGKAAQEAGAILSDEFIENTVIAKEQLNLLNLKWEGFKANAINDVMIPSIKALSDNLEMVKAVMMVGGAYLVGSYIPAIYQSVVAKKAKIVAAIEEIQAENAAIIQTQRKAQAEYNAAQAEMTRARDAVISAEMQVNADRAVIASEIQRMQTTIAATSVEKAQEVQRLSSQINDAGRAQSISRMAQLQQVQAIQVAELTALEAKLGATTLATSRVYEAARNTQTAATTRLTTATAGLNAANAMSARSYFGLLGALGGPVGLGLTVAAVAASYLLLKGSTDESTKSLRENNESVDDAIAKYRELDAARRDSQIIAEKEQLKELAKSYDNATDSLITNAYALTRHNDVTTTQSKELNALIAEFKETKNLEDFRSKIKALTFINQESKDKFVVLAGAVSKTGSEYKTQQSLIEKMISLSPNAVKATDARTTAADRERKAIEAASKAYSEYSKTALSDIQEMAARKLFQERGLSKNQSDARVGVLKAFNYNNAALKTDAGQEAISLASISASMKDKEEARAEALKKQTEELKEQGKALKLNAQIQANAAKYNFAGLESKYNLPKGTLSAIHAIETGNTGKTNQVNKTTGASGGFQFMPDTAKRFNISGQTFDLGKSAEAAAKYMNYLLELFKGDLEKAVRAYHAGEGNVQRGTNIGKYNNDYWKKYQGYTAGASGQTFGTDYTVENYLSDLDKADEAFRKFQQDKAQFSQQFSSEDVIRNQERIDTIAKANELGLQHLIPKIEEHYANKARLAELQFDQELNSWNWTEDEKLKKEAELNKAHIALSSELNDVEKQLKKESIDEQLAYDLQQFRKAQKWKEFEAINNFKAIQDQIQGLGSNTD